MAAAVFLNIIVHPTWITQSSKHMFLLTVTSVYSELTSFHIVIILLVPIFFLQVHKFHHIVWLCPWCVFFMVLLVSLVSQGDDLYLYSALNILFVSLQCAQYIVSIFTVRSIYWWNRSLPLRNSRMPWRENVSLCEEYKYKYNGRLYKQK